MRIVHKHLPTDIYQVGSKYDYEEMEITWDNGNTTTVDWNYDGEMKEVSWRGLMGVRLGRRLFLETCQGKTKRQIDLDIYHGRVEGYNHWQRIGTMQPIDDYEVCT